MRSLNVLVCLVVLICYYTAGVLGAEESKDYAKPPPVIIASMNHFGDVVITYAPIPVSTYTVFFSITNAPTFGETHQHLSSSGTEFKIRLPVACYLISMYFSSNNGSRSDTCDPVFFCVSGYTYRKTGGGGQGGNEGGQIDNYNVKSLFGSKLIMAPAPNGEMVVIDRDYNSVRYIDFSGVVTSLEVNLTLSPSLTAVAVHPINGKIYLLDSSTRDIITYSIGRTSPIRVATLPCSAPTLGDALSITATSDDVFYITCGKCQVLYSFDSATNRIHTIMQGYGTQDGVNGTAGFLFPSSVCYTPNEFGLEREIIIADSPAGLSASIRRLKPDGTLVTVAGKAGETITSTVDNYEDGTLGEVAALACTTFLNRRRQVFFIDKISSSIRAVNLISGGTATYMGQNATQLDPTVSRNFKNISPYSLAFDSNNDFLYFSSQYYHAIFLEQGSPSVVSDPPENVVISCEYDYTLLSWDDYYNPAYHLYDIVISPGGRTVTTAQRRLFMIDDLQQGITYSFTINLNSPYELPPNPPTVTCTTKQAVCGNSIIEPGEDCEGGSCCSNVTCSFLPNTEICNPSAGICDVDELCTGSSATCPPNEFKPVGVCDASSGLCEADALCTGNSPTCPAKFFLNGLQTCRPAANNCDLPEVCNGSSIACPPDQFEPYGTVCRPSAGDCDLTEVCDGYGSACAADSFANGIECRGSTDECDVPEFCLGSSASCPPDEFYPSGHVCRSVSGGCDVAEVCDGSSSACPLDKFHNSTYVCRPSVDLCDSAEKCDGISSGCPSDINYPSGTVCRIAAGVCDRNEICDGISNACPADSFLDDTVVCRASAGDCDIPENCNGSAADCPTDTFQKSTYVCREPSDLCDSPEMCTGNTAACPLDLLQPSTFICRNATTICDIAENCTGSTSQCPGDTYAPSTKVCRPAAGTCDVPEMCTGSSPACPLVDSFYPDTIVCRNASGSCDLPENCTGLSPRCPSNEVVPIGIPCRLSAGICDLEEVCDGSNPECPTDVFRSPIVVCNITVSDICDSIDYCDGSSPLCPDIVLPSNTQCNAPSGNCFLAPVCDGTTKICPSTNYPVICTNNGTCDLISGACICSNGNPYPFCNQPANCSATNTCDCEPGRYGATCTNCTCDKGTCLDGRLGNGTCLCDLGWTGTNCHEHVEPKVLYAIFSNSGTSVTVVFDIPTNQSGLVPCDTILATDSIVKIGNRAMCFWDNSTWLTISFNNGNPTLLPGNILILLPGTIGSSQTPSRTSSGAFVVLAPVNPVPVTITIQGPAYVGSCNPFTLIAQVFGTGGRQVQIMWTLDDNGADRATTYNASIPLITANDSNSSSSILSAPASFLTPSFQYIIRVAATNYLGLIGETTFTIRRTSTPTPNVQINTPATVQTFSHNALAITSTITSCLSTNLAAVWNWSIYNNVTRQFVTIPGVNLAVSRLSIPGLSLRAGDNYTISLNAYFTANSSLVGRASTFVQVKLQALIAVIAGSSILSHPANSTLILDASGSRDPDRISSLTGSWTVQVITGSSLTLPAGNSLILTIPSTLLVQQDSSYLFTYTCTDGTRSSSASVRVDIIAPNKPGVSITCANCQPFRANTKLVLYGRVTGLADLASATYRWSELIGEGEFDFNSKSVLSSRTSLNLVLAPYALKDGFRYEFQLEVITASGISHAVQSVFSRPLPQGGVFSIVPSRGAALYTPFSLQCNGWNSYDGSSVKYSFAYVLNGVRTPITSSSFTSVETVMLPSPNTTSNILSVVAFIVDAYSGVTEVTYDVIVESGNKESALAILDDVLNNKPADTDLLLRELLLSTSQLKVIGGVISPNQTQGILDIVNNIATSVSSSSTTVQLSQLVASITVTSPDYLYSPQFLSSLTLLANSSTNSESSRDSLAEAVSNVYGNAHITSAQLISGWFDYKYSSSINDIINMVFISASQDLVCGEKSNILKTNLQMQAAKEFPKNLEGTTVKLPATGESVFIPSGLFSSIVSPPSCVSTQFVLRSSEAFLGTDNSLTSVIASKVQTFALWDNGKEMEIKDAPPFKILLPLENYQLPECFTNSTSCEVLLCSYWNYENKTWDTTGLSVASSTATHFVCQTTHLTDFALFIGLKQLGGSIDDTIKTFGKIKGNPYAIIFVSAIYALYAVSIFAVWFVDAKQDIETKPIIKKFPARPSPPPPQHNKHLALHHEKFATPRNNLEGITFQKIKNKMIKRLKQQHTWVTVYYRAQHDHFSRIRRITVLLSLVMCIIAITSIYLRGASDKDDSVIPGTTIFEIAYVSSLLAILPNILILLFFYKARPRPSLSFNDLSSDEEFEDEEERTKIKTRRARLKKEKDLERQREIERGQQGKWQAVVKGKWQWWWSIVAFVLAFILALLSGYVSILYGTQFTTVQLSAWLVTCISAVLLDAFVNQVVASLLCVFFILAFKVFKNN